MKSINAFAVSMRGAGAGWALQAYARPMHAAAHAHATAPTAAPRKRRTADATGVFVDRGPI